MNKTGILGEKIAIKYLKSRGYKIVQKNFKTKCGEIDIIAKDGECICFIEARTRTSDSFLSPYESVNYFKQKRIIKTAQIWLTKNKFDNSLCRFDVISILFNENYRTYEITLIKDAFWAE